MMKRQPPIMYKGAIPVRINGLLCKEIQARHARGWGAKSLASEYQLSIITIQKILGGKEHAKKH